VSCAELGTGIDDITALSPSNLRYDTLHYKYVRYDNVVHASLMAQQRHFLTRNQKHHLEGNAILSAINGRMPEMIYIKSNEYSITNNYNDNVN